MPADERGGVLRAVATLFETHRAELVALCVREAGRTVADSLAEVREAVRPRLQSVDGAWVADYVRLRFIAHTPPLRA